MLAGKYRVERIIGQGGMGVVVEARHVVLDERVALKFLLPDFAQHREGAERFLREAKAAVKIKSEHVARVSDVGELESGAPYMVMEFLVGGDLAGVLHRKGPLPLEDAVDYLIQASEAIAEAHAHGIIHRDIKPANMFLTARADGSPLVKVLDFGISKMTTGNVENLTKTTAALGSALYMSPEQMQQTRSVDHRTDIYALGVSLFELLAGRPPFYAETLPQLCAEVLTGIPMPLRHARPDISPAFAATLERAYARDRNARYSSVAELVVALAPFAPPQSHPSIARIARMGGLAVPTPDAAGQRASQPTFAPALGPSAGADTPMPNDGGRLSPVPPSAGSAAQQIVPGPYSAPMSARAAATFASATGMGLAAAGRTPGGSSTAALLALVVAALCVGLGVGFIVRWSRAGATEDAAMPAPSAAEHAPAASPDAEAVEPPPPSTASVPAPAVAPAPSHAGPSSAGSSSAAPDAQPPASPLAPATPVASSVPSARATPRPAGPRPAGPAQPRNTAPSPRPARSIDLNNPL